MPTTHTTRLRRPLATVGLIAGALALAPGAASGAGVALSTSGWSWTNPAPQGNTLTRVSFVGNTGFASGEGGTVLRSEDGGTTWSGLPTGTGDTIFGLDVVDASTLVARVGNAQPCALRISIDGGATFNRVVFDGTETSCAVSIASESFVSGTTGYVLMADGRVLKTTDGGASFGNASRVDGAQQVAFRDATIGYALTATTLKRTPDGGQTWTDVSTVPAGTKVIRLLPGNDIVAWGKDVLSTSTDGGATWSSHNLDGLDPESVTCRTISQCALYGANQLVRTTDGGATLAKAGIGNTDVRAVGYAAGTRLVAAGKRGVTYLSNDDGATFARSSSEPVADAITSIDVRGAGGPVGLTDNGRIARLSGDTWSLLPTLSTGRIVDADFVDAKVGFALGASGNLQRTSNGGATWTQLDPGTPSRSRFVLAFDASTQVLLGDFGAYRSGQEGRFEVIKSKALRKVRVDGVDADGTRAALWDSRTGRAAIRVSSDAGAQWSTVKLPRKARRVSQVAVIPGKGLLAIIDGQLQRSSTDRGSWKVLAATGAEIETLEAASATEYLVVPKNSAWYDSIILRTADSGASWAPESLAGGGDQIAALAVESPTQAWAAVRDGNQYGLFSSATSGVRGDAGDLSLSRTKSRQSAKNKIAIDGTLAGAKGTESVRVAWRKRGTSGRWYSSYGTVGANGGSFGVRVSLSKGTYDVVAQWTGDSARAGRGSKAITLKVTK